jgi:hypothetical protein
MTLVTMNAIHANQKELEGNLEYASRDGFAVH